jgi:hypothetical protein
MTKDCMIPIKVGDLETLKTDVEEQETTISFYRNSNEACIYTSDNTTLTKLKKVVNKDPENYSVFIASINSSHKPSGYLFKCPKKYIKFGSKSNRAPMTEEQKQAIRNRFKK